MANYKFIWSCKALTYSLLIFLALQIEVTLCALKEDAKTVSNDFTLTLLDKYGSEGQISRLQFQQLGVSLGVDPAYVDSSNEIICVSSPANNCSRKVGRTNENHSNFKT